MQYVSKYALSRNYEHSAGIDLPCAEKTIVKPGIINKISTGVYLEIPPGMYGKIEARSGLAIKYGSQILAGIIDNDYRGELIVLMKTDQQITFNPGDRCAQVIIMKYEQPKLIPARVLGKSVRNNRGFGSSGV